MDQDSNGITSMKEQVYMEKVRQLNTQLDMILNRTHPDYIQGKILIEQELEDRLFCNEVSFDLKRKTIDVDYENALFAIQKDFEEKKLEMKESLINELEERKKQIEHEYVTMELNGEGAEVKQAPKRNLRRRFNDPASASDKKSRKTSPTVNTLLTDAEIEDDLSKILCCSHRNVGQSASSGASSAYLARSSPTLSSIGAGLMLAEGSSPSKRQNSLDEKREKSVDLLGDEQRIAKDGGKSAKISSTAAEQIYQSNGKLFYRKKCFTKGQPVVLTAPDSSKLNAVIQTVGTKEIVFRLVGDGNKRLNVSVLHLQQGKYSLKKRTS